jgi:hypothetical protein
MRLQFKEVSEFNSIMGKPVFSNLSKIFLQQHHRLGASGVVRSVLSGGRAAAPAIYINGGGGDLAAAIAAKTSW